MGEPSLDYRELASSEMKDLRPFLTNQEIGFISYNIKAALADYPHIKPSICLDLEQLQIADYPSLFPEQEQQARILRRIQDSGLFDQRELNFLTLRSLVTLCWPQPTSNDELHAMADAETRVHAALTDLAEVIREQRPHQAIWLPYWARLAQLNLIRNLPPALQEKFGPAGMPCVLLRSRDVNAHAFRLGSKQVIVLDYALEPFLKSMNVFLHSYFHTRHQAGPMRISRAFAELVPRILFFKGQRPAYAFTPYSLLFDQHSLTAAKWCTDDQIKFLVLHEMGHAALAHPAKHEAMPGVVVDDSLAFEHIVREHMYEHEADAFALNWVRSAALNSLRYHLHPKRSADSGRLRSTMKAIQNDAHDYAAHYLNVRLLFEVLGFVETFYTRLSARISGLPTDGFISSHPPYLDRWKRLENLCLFDVPISSDFLTYSQELLKNVLEFMSLLSGTTIDDLIKEALSDGRKNSDSR